MWTPRPSCAVLCVVVMTGCADALTRPEDGIGPFEGRWDGKTWNGRGFAVLIDDTLHVVGHLRPDPRYFYDELVRVYTPFRGEGRYTIDSGYASLEQITGGDAGSSSSARGVLTVTEVDRVRGQVRGTVALSADRPGYEWEFEDGRFLLPIYADFADGWRALGSLRPPRFPRIF